MGSKSQSVTKERKQQDLVILCDKKPQQYITSKEKKHHSIPPIRTLCKNPKPLKSTSVVSIRTGKKQVRFSRSSPQIFSIFEHQPHNDDNNNKSRENDGKEAILVEDELQEV